MRAQAATLMLRINYQWGLPGASMVEIHPVLQASYDVLRHGIVILIILAVILIIVLFIIDVTQTGNAVRRNYPVIGRFRRFFEHLGEFFRQYFFAMDREEKPFNRAERTWAERAAMNVDNTVAFGSTRDLTPPGTVLFVNHPFPPLEADHDEPAAVTVGPDCPHPYTTNSLINISAMSYGALSNPAVRALSAGAKAAGCWMNTGEGGLSPAHLSGGADVIFQIGTAKYGVRDGEGNLSDEKLREVAAREQIRMFEIKLSQGAKPGKGGILPAIKVTAEISGIRGIPEGQDSLSPNRHPEITSVGDILDMVDHVRQVTGKPVGFKTVVGNFGWLEEFCDEIARRGPASAPDFITIDSADGGTGAAPMSLLDNVGLPLRESLPGVVDLLRARGLRQRIKVIASGKLIVPAEAAWAFCVGADFVNSARGFMFSLGCIQALKCNKNTCPTGITTHNARLQRGLDVADKSERVTNYARNLAAEIAIIAHSCGVTEPRQLGREHCRIVLPGGRSVPLDELYPEPDAVAAE